MLLPRPERLDDYYTKTLTAFVSTAVAPFILWVVVASLDSMSAMVLAHLPLIPVFMILIGKNTRDETAEAQAELQRLRPYSGTGARPAPPHRSGAVNVHRPAP